MGFLVDIIRYLLEAYVVVLIVAALMSWFPENPYSPFAPVRRIVDRLTEPVLSLVRKVLPPLRIGGMGIDLSVIVVIIVIEILVSII
jgi:YggT family protein